MTITGEKKVVSNFAGKWKSGNTTVKVFENNKNRKKRRNKGNKAGIS